MSCLPVYWSGCSIIHCTKRDKRKRWEAQLPCYDVYSSRHKPEPPTTGKHDRHTGTPQLWPETKRTRLCSSCLFFSAILCVSEAARRHVFCTLFHLLCQISNLWCFRWAAIHFLLQNRLNHDDAVNMVGEGGQGDVSNTQCADEITKCEALFLAKPVNKTPGA